MGETSKATVPLVLKSPEFGGDVTKHLESVNQKTVKDKYGHNLERAYQNLPPSQQILSPGELRTLQAASSIYKDKGFEYFCAFHAAKGFKRFPDLAALDVVTLKLVR